MDIEAVGLMALLGFLLGASAWIALICMWIAKAMKDEHPSYDDDAPWR